ncbi:MAG: hypothetical protein QME06_00485 [Desulfobacterales bacterium]|nr:hypothetical protein [Desulfobacterales bacterium]
MKRVYELDIYKLAEALEKNMKAKFDGLVKSQKIPFYVIPAKAGIQ